MTGARIEDIEFARNIDGQTIHYREYSWQRIGELSRRGLVRVVAISRWSAEIHAIGEAAQ